MTPSRFALWMVWLTASIFYAYQYILRVMPNIMLGDIMEKFQIDAAAFGQFSGIYYIGYSLMHLPIGLFLDRFGPRKVMTGSILLTVIGLMPLIFADHWSLPIAGRLLVGIGSSAAILGLFKIIRMTFSEKKFSRMLSLSVTIGLIGAIYGGGPVSYMRDHFGFEFVAKSFAGIGIALAFLTYWIVPEMKHPPQTNVLSDLKEALSNRRVVSSCIFAGLMVGPLEGFADVWGAAFLKQVYGFDATAAASIPSMIFIGMCFGAPVLNWFAEKIGFLPAIVAAGCTMATVFLSLIAFEWPAIAITIAFTLVGVSCAYQILTIYKASTYVREEVAGLTTAAANMIIMLFGYVFHSVIGAIVELFGGPNTPQALVYGISIIPIALMIGSLGFMSLLASERKQVTSPLGK